MSITQTLEDYKALIESLPSKPKVDLFSGSVVEDTLKNITLDGKQCYVLLACGGGPIISERPVMVCDAVFGAFVIARSDHDTKGVSRQAMNMGVEISRLLKKYRGSSAGNPNLPKIQSFEELLSGFKGNNFSAWQLSWTHFVSFD
ncbi:MULTISPECIES: hypothetical protein [Pseudomonas]|uniref:hypothetical protein n=1 Tax=Pseudomonas TaxID=286 RepID=UPI00345DB82E